MAEATGIITVAPPSVPATARVPTLALAPDRPPAYVPNFTLRGPAELWLTW